MSDFVGSLHLTDPWATGTPDYSAVGGSPANDDAFGDDKLDFFNDAVDMLDAEQQGWTYETIAAAPEQVFEVFNSSTPSPTGPANSLEEMKAEDELHPEFQPDNPVDDGARQQENEDILPPIDLNLFAAFENGENLTMEVKLVNVDDEQLASIAVQHPPLNLIPINKVVMTLNLPLPFNGMSKKTAISYGGIPLKAHLLSSRVRNNVSSLETSKATASFLWEHRAQSLYTDSLGIERRIVQVKACSFGHGQRDLRFLVVDFQRGTQGQQTARFLAFQRLFGEGMMKDLLDQFEHLVASGQIAPQLQ